MFLTPSDFKNYLYCPRQIFYKYVLQIKEFETEKMRIGIEYQEKISSLEKRRILKKYGIDCEFKKYFNLYIKDDFEKISGTIDMIIETEDEIIPVDFKLNFIKITTGIELQLKAYSLIAKNKFNKQSKRGFFYFIIQDVIKEINLESDEIDKLFEKTKNEIFDIIKNEKFPEIEPDYERCIECGYKNFCNDFK